MESLLSARELPFGPQKLDGVMVDLHCPRVLQPLRNYQPNWLPARQPKLVWCRKCETDNPLCSKNWTVFDQALAIPWLYCFLHSNLGRFAARRKGGDIYRRIVEM